MITVQELEKTLKECKDSCPGPDGIPYSILGAIWQNYGPILCEAWNHSLVTGNLPPSHKVSFLKLIPKAGKDLKKLTNWRPITLSNCDHKLITKTYSNQICDKIADHIGQRQTAYLKGRLINDNIRSMIASIKVANSEENIDALMVSLDAKKAFDSVEHSYIKKCLEKVGLADFIPIFEVLYSELRSDVIINGKVVNGYRILRGVKQGDALSCVLFIICMEPLLRNIEKNPAIEGIHSAKLESILPKAYGYADDVNCLISNKLESLQALFNEYSRLTNLSGLELNASKTELLKICSPNVRSIQHDYAVLYGNQNHTITPVIEMKINGILFQQDLNRMKDSNVANVGKKMERHLRSWSGRSLTILGKILILKTYGISQLIYLSQSMCLSETHFKKLNGILYKFIWNRHFLAAKAPERISRILTNKPIKLGGLGMLDISELDSSLKLKALGRLKSTSHPFLCLIRNKLNLDEFFFPMDKLKLEEVASKAVELIRSDRQNLWKVRDLNSNRQYLNAVKSSKIWSALSPNGRLSLAYLRIRLRGLTYLDELNRVELDSLRPFLNPDLSRVLTETSRINRNFVAGVDPINYSMVHNLKFYDLNNLSSKQIRTFRTNKEPVRDLKIGVTLDPTQGRNWGHNLAKITSTKHKDVLLRLAHGELYSKERLHRYRLIDSPDCSRCGHIETLKHKFVECPYARAIWTKALALTDRIKTHRDSNEPLPNRILCSTFPNPTVMTIHAEILLRIKGLREDQNFLLRPIVIIKNALKLIIKRESSTDVKEVIAQLLSDCDQV